MLYLGGGGLGGGGGGLGGGGLGGGGGGLGGGGLGGGGGGSGGGGLGGGGLMQQPTRSKSSETGRRIGLCLCRYRVHCQYPLRTVEDAETNIVSYHRYWSHEGNLERQSMKYPCENSEK